MAQRTQIILIDDVDGTEATDTVQFGLDGVTYEIDLNGANAHAFRAAMGDWIGSARRVGGRKNTARSGGSGGQRLSLVRKWARENGHKVSDRGRVPAAVQAAYDRAHG